MRWHGCPPEAVCGSLIFLATNVKAQPISTTERTFFMKPRIGLAHYEERLTENVTWATDPTITPRELDPSNVSFTAVIPGRLPIYCSPSHFTYYGQWTSVTHRDGLQDCPTICARFEGVVTFEACNSQELNQQQRQSDHREYDEGGPACVMPIALVRQGNFTNTLSPV